MLLQRLVEYAAEKGGGPPFHRELEFSWQLDLDASGKPSPMRLTQLVEPVERGRPRGVRHLAPAAVRTVGVAPQLAADDVQYVLGWGDAESRPERVAQCHAAFVELTKRWAASDSGLDDPVAQAVWAFYRDGHLLQLQPGDGVTAKQRVMIAVDGLPAVRAPSVVPFWTAEVARRKGGTAAGVCLVCGRFGPLLDTVPGKVPSSLVPLATNDAALVSINESVFGYGLTTQLGSTPLCMACGDAITTGLRGVLESRHSLSYGGQDSRIAWWVTGSCAGGDVMDLIYAPDPQRVNELFGAVQAGKQAAEIDPARFCSLAVGGNVARVVVRDWVEMPLFEFKENAAAWFADTEMVPRWRDGRRWHGLALLALCTGRWQRRERTYARFAAKGANRPDGVQRDLLRAAVRGRPLPPSLLAHLVHRVCTDGHLDDPRAALLRLALTRLNKPDDIRGDTPGLAADPPPLAGENKPMPSLDPSNTNPAYIAGRAFAVMASLQEVAHRVDSDRRPKATEADDRQADKAKQQINATYTDRYFAGAVTNPCAAIVSGRKDAAAWLRKLRRRNPGQAVNYDKRLTEIFDLLDAEPGIPGRTTLREQALFLIGYHHQRAHQFTKKQTADTPDTDTETTAGETE
jgi:CRISPR-associated protein Csd1